MAFKKATKSQARLRLGISGPPGAGKSFTALSVGKHLGKRMAAIDTERGSLSKYAGDVADFDVLELEHFSVENYLKALREAAEAGYDVLVVDSLSHAWAGRGGVLEEVDKRGGKFDAWRYATPLQQKLVDAILGYPGHIIVTMRSKVDYQVSTVERNGKRETKVEKLGMAPVQRDDFAYELDVVMDMNERNAGSVTKSRCPAIAGVMIDKPGRELAETLLKWLGEGEAAPERPLAEQQSTGAFQTRGTTAGEDTQTRGQTTTSTATKPSTQTSATSEPKLDEYGLEIPTCPCPVVRPGRPNAGKRWDELPGPLVAKMLDENGNMMTPDQLRWAEYLVTKRQARKAREAAAVAMAAEAGFVPDEAAQAAADAEAAP